MSPSTPTDPRREHAAMLQTLHAACCAVITGELATARIRLDALGRLQARHIRYEEQVLLPRLPQHPRWTAAVYLAEHRKLESLLQRIRAQWCTLPPRLDDPAQRLAVLDALHPLRHVLEHHFEREEQALFDETREVPP